jgi:acyl-CoA hydrolase
MKTPPAHQLSMTVLMTPDMANFLGNVHGGHILKLLDQVAYACASRYAQRYVVTLSVDQVVSGSPFTSASSSRSSQHQLHGTTSMEVGIKVVTENIQSQVVRHANSCFFTMVAVNEEGRPCTSRNSSRNRPISGGDSKRRRRAGNCGGSWKPGTAR